MSTKLTYNKAVVLKPAIKDKCVPDDFYSTTNHATMIYWRDRWVTVQNQRMDALIVVNEAGAFCKKLRDIKKGDYVVCGDDGVKIQSSSSDENGEAFGFMNNCVSSERRNELLIRALAVKIASQKSKVVVVAGPVVVHTGGDRYLTELIREGYVSGLLSGNAVAVHDMEKSMFGTSLGICHKSGRPVENGYRNHMRAINRIMKHGSIKEAVEAGELKSGIMYECVVNNVPYALAGSLRDDGPLPDTITDMIQAQNEYNKLLQEVDVVLVLGSMLHGIATGNMLPAEVEMVCVDINPAVVTKLSDRGSSQAAGIVTDVGLFLNLLTKELRELKAEAGNETECMKRHAI